MPEGDPPEVAELMDVGRRVWRGVQGSRSAFSSRTARVARRQLRWSLPVRIVQTTALVHDAYMRLNRDSARVYLYQRLKGNAEV